MTCVLKPTTLGWIDMKAVGILIGVFGILLGMYLVQFVYTVAYMVATMIFVLMCCVGLYGSIRYFVYKWSRRE